MTSTPDAAPTHATTPADLTATDMLERFATGELSPVEATEATLTRIADADPAVNAYCLVDADRALDQARAAETRWARGEPRGRLDGVPTSIKDIFLTRDWPTLRGSRTIDPHQPRNAHAPALAPLRQNTPRFFVKTHTPPHPQKTGTHNHPKNP
ncbi:amidase family protein, partial [Saccharopolyspora sp. 6V]|uniref:amidase family protein n=1 Tax=Saccharopolyspora sp. 6V TaxID=2877239 RepID=UPI0021027221